ncbi:MAG: hypothetical protein DRN90_05325 [Thermoproteota archaeon]|nr:MAG: hypothetical protein DRN92_06935 [Candidatus Korarchaeota archaeon]RLG47210.1 MAG: hypothetical protein DRN90_05325 [Candidatus Korarchaeota archaeon]
MFSPKKPWLAALLNLLLPGLGFVYVGGLVWIILGAILIIFFWGLSPIAWFFVTGAGIGQISAWTIFALITAPLGIYAARRRNKKMQEQQELVAPLTPKPETQPSLATEEPEIDRREVLGKLENALLEGRISEETYLELKRKYENVQRKALPERPSIDLSGELELRACEKQGESFKVSCPHCQGVMLIKSSAFTNDLAERSRKNVTATQERISIGREPSIFGIPLLLVIITFVIAYSLGIGFFIAAALASIVYITVGPIFSYLLAHKMPVWLVQCDNCGEKMILASDGSKAFVVVKK